MITLSCSLMEGISTRGTFDAAGEVIWILEDDPDIGFVLEIFLDQEGFKTELLNTAGKFREATERGLPDLFLMDVMLPDGDGVDLCNVLKAQERSRNIPVLMMSAHADLARINDCRPNGFLAKPFDLEKLLVLVRAQLGQASR